MMTETIQWEYRALTVGTFWNDPKDEDLENELNQLGQEGWEVINVLTHHSTNKYRVIAKRPLSSETRRRRSWPG
jgi:hypothetical protein